MIKIYCDFCGIEPPIRDFMFEATVKEAVPVFEMGNKSLNPRYQMQTTMHQLCERCYKDKFLPIINKNAEEKNN